MGEVFGEEAAGGARDESQGKLGIDGLQVGDLGEEVLAHAAGSWGAGSVWERRRMQKEGKMKCDLKWKDEN